MLLWLENSYPESYTYIYNITYANAGYYN